jgi:hypothetical protein
MIPPSRPNRNNAVIDAIAERYGLDLTKASLIFIRSYYLDTLGKKGVGDSNLYDDACYLVSPAGRESWNANTEASFPDKGYAVMNLGKYQYYKGKHKNLYAALRPYPEGVVLKCTRNGKPSTCSHTNIHKGGTNPRAFDKVWSQGCLTIPATQWPDFQTRVYELMSRYKQKTVDVVIVENRLAANGTQQIFDDKGEVI